MKYICTYWVIEIYPLSEWNTSIPTEWMKYNFTHWVKKYIYPLSKWNILSNEINYTHWVKEICPLTEWNIPMSEWNTTIPTEWIKYTRWENEIQLYLVNEWNIPTEHFEVFSSVLLNLYLLLLQKTNHIWL